MSTTEKTIKETYNNRRSNISNKDYLLYLKSNEWVKLKNNCLKKKRFRRCRKKGCCNTKIELHHTSYRRIKTKDEAKDLIPLCRKHHQLIHDISKKTGLSVKLSTNMVIYTRSEYNIKDI